MQYSDIAFLKKASLPGIAGYVLKGFIFIVIVAFIAIKLREHPVRVSELSVVLSRTLQTQGLGVLAGLLVLSCLNWLLEAYKWKVLVSKVEKIGLAAGVKGVFTGLSLGFITPHAVGDYAGRIWQLKGNKRVESLGAILLGRALQYFATFTFGLFGTAYLLFYVSIPHNFFLFSLTMVSAAFLLGTVLFLYCRNIFLKTLEFKLLRKFKKYFAIIITYSFREIIQLIGLAFGRYFIFAAQFFIMLSLFSVSENALLLIAGVSWTLLAKSSIPAFNFLSDLGVREFSALYFFSHYTTDSTLVVIASFALWCINILLPAIVGLLGIINMKIFRRA